MNEMELKRLERRVARLQLEEEMEAPNIIKIFELRLIIESCEKLLNLLLDNE